MKMLFPPRLDKGAKGPEVKWLQYNLLFGGYNRGIDPDGDYGDQTAQGVSNLQAALGFSGDDIDGNFGPRTRAALYAQRGIDINNIPEDVLVADGVDAA